MLNNVHLTAGDHAVLIAAWQSIVPNAKVNYAVLASKMGYKNSATANAVFHHLKKKLQLDGTLIVDRKKGRPVKRGIVEVEDEAVERKKRNIKLAEKEMDESEGDEGVEIGREQWEGIPDTYDYSDYPDGEVPVDVETERLRAQFRIDHPGLYPELVKDEDSDDEIETELSGVKAEGGGRCEETEVDVLFEDVRFPDQQKAELVDWDGEIDEAAAEEWIFHGAQEFLRQI